MKPAYMTLTDIRQFDYRIKILHIIISGLENSILELKMKLDELEWYDGLWLLEESEPICGLAFIAMQNYINSSIYDRFESMEKQYLAYKMGNKISGTERTDIELIISIANYFKHRDHPNDLSGETSRILADFHLHSYQGADISNSPIFKGLEIFSENWEFKEYVKAVEIWRAKLWLIDCDNKLSSAKAI